MPRVAPLCPAPSSRLQAVAAVRVLYADTDKMGIVYHGSYLRYLEMARVECIRQAGVPYTELEDEGLALPVSDLAVRYHAPALYDDRMTLEVGLSMVTPARVHFDYRIVVLAGDRRGLSADLDILVAQTRHACIVVGEGRPRALPERVFDVLRARVTSP
ncbi:MAG: acyl-CoA thioesterase [Nannocystaceae bacterium]|nr:acyl-CoA thioesterase [bacterium]